MLSFSTCSQSFNKICEWEVLGANVLKNRFRKLKTMMDIDKIDDIPEIIVSACILLHNICIIEDGIEDFLDDSNDDDDNDDNDDDVSPPGVGAVDKKNIM